VASALPYQLMAAKKRSSKEPGGRDDLGFGSVGYHRGLPYFYPTKNSTARFLVPLADPSFKIKKEGQEEPPFFKSTPHIINSEMSQAD